MRTKKKRGVEAPCRVRTFIDSVTIIPLDEIHTPLAGFSWEYEEGDFYHWVDLWNHFECFFEKYITPRRDLQLDSDCLEETLPFPKESVLQILRVTRIVLENCVNKYVYNSNEHLSALFACTDPEVVVSALETMAAFVKKPLQPNRAMRWHGDAVLNARLFSMSQGWGGKEEGLGLLACAMVEGCDADACRLGSTLHFEFYEEGDCLGDDGGTVALTSGLQVIHISNLHLREESALQLLKQLTDEYKVPLRLRFSLLTRIRFAMAFSSVTSRRHYISVRLLAFTVFLQSNPDQELLTSFFINEPEFVNELMEILRRDDVVPEDIRILAVFALAAQSQGRPRQSNVLNVISAGGHGGILPSLTHKAIGAITGGPAYCSVAFVEALLSLVTVLVSSSSGCAALREAGLIPTLLSLLKDVDSQHTNIVSTGVHILEAFMDHSNPAGTLFRDLGGLDDMIGRLKLEVSFADEGATKQEACSQADSKGKAPMIEDGDSPQVVARPGETIIPYHQRLLLKALLRAIALGTYATGSTTRLHGSEESALPKCLCIIFRHAREFGGGVFSLAASVMSDLIHKDPTRFPSLNAAGLPEAFLDAIASDVLTSSEAVGCIPNSLDALCLNNLGLQAVKERNALGCFVRIFTSKVYLKSLANGTLGSLASGVEDLMRHAPTLRGPGIDMCIEILRVICKIGGVSQNASTNFHESLASDVPSPMDTEDRSGCSAEDGVLRGDPSPRLSESGPVGSDSNLEAFLPECINNVVRLLETVLQNAETSKIFIEKKGIETFLQLYTLPHLPISFGGSSTAHNMSVTFRSFSPQHASALTRAVCLALRDHLRLTVGLVDSIRGAKLSDLEYTTTCRVVRYLSAAESLISLSTVLVRSSPTMMPELSNGGDVFADLGNVHRVVLWQIALIDDAKIDSRKGIETSGSTLENTSTSTGCREGEEDADVYSVNPVASRNGPASHWELESDFIPVPHRAHGRRREHAITTEAITQMARIGRLTRQSTDAHQVDLESSSSHLESSGARDPKRRSPDLISYEILTRLVASVRGLYVALGKALVIPSSRRREESVSISGPAKVIALALAKLLHEELSFGGDGSSSHNEQSVSVKCRYLGKAVEDIIGIVFDSRRRTCNTVLVNSLFAQGAIKQLLATFAATSQLLWRVPFTFVSPMEMENGKAEVDMQEDKSDSNSWLLDTLKNYARLLEHLVTSSLLLTPSSMAQLLVQPVINASEPVPKDTEGFIRALQAQVLEVVLPVWNHSLFPRCSPSLITSIAAIITHVYTGVGDVKGQRNGAGNTVGNRLLGPPDEFSISRIMEMGFSRSRAEEALRQVEVNSVERATEWLCNHPERGGQQDDELARALALSSGNPDGSSKLVVPGKENEVGVEEGSLQAPPVEDMLSTCMKLLQNADAVAFPLTDLLVTMCNYREGQDRPRVVSYLVQLLQQSKVDDESQSYDSSMSTLCHTLALVLSEDCSAREIAGEIGLVNISLEILNSFSLRKDPTLARLDFPKWATSLLLVLYHMLQFKPTLNLDPPIRTAGSVNAADGRVDVSDRVADVPKQKDDSPFVTILGKPAGYMTDVEQRKSMSVCCRFLEMKLSAIPIQAVLQLCARLTKTHSVAMQFLEAGGLTALLGLPATSIFPGFESVAAAIIRHLLEDPHTLQHAMESEIRHTLVATISRHHGPVSPRMFLTAMAPVVSRDPSVFMLAVGCVCRIETLGGRPTVALAKEKEKELDKERIHEKEREKNLLGGEGGLSHIDGGSRSHDGLGKQSKGHKKVPHSFSQVIDQLLEVILHHLPPGRSDPSLKDGSVTAMDVDDQGLNQKGKAKVEELSNERAMLPENPAPVPRVAFILKLTTEVLLMYHAAVSVVLRRDSESSQGRGPSQGGLDVIGHGGLLYHVLHRLLPYPGSKVNEKLDEWKEKLFDRAAYFLMAVCVRSGEGRRRVVIEIARTLSETTESPNDCLKGLRPPSRKVRVFVDLVNSLLSSNSASASPQPPGFATDMAKTMMDAGLVQALTHTLQVTDLDHPDAPKLVNSLLKAMEVLTRPVRGDQTYGSEGSMQKNGGFTERSIERVVARELPLSDTQAGDENMRDTTQDGVQLAVGGAHHTSLGANSSREDLMEHDMRLDRDSTEETQLDADAEEEFMREAAEDVVELENAPAEMAYRMEHHPDENVGDEDEDEEDMDGEDNEDDEEEDEGEEEIEGNGRVLHLSPPDTDVDDHEDNDLVDEDDDDMVEEEEDEDEDWHEDRVTEMRWRDALTGLNHVQILGHTGAANLIDFSGDPFQGANMDEVFGNFRRPSGGDRRRATAYRSFPERQVADRRTGFHHPFLTRPPLAPGTGSMGPFISSNLWPTTGGSVRDAEAMIGGGGMDVTHFYMYETPTLSDHAGDGLFGERDVVNPPPPLLDGLTAVDPLYLMGRRGRIDSRLSSWTDDGQPQAGPHAAAVAQAIEEQFVSHLQVPIPGENQCAGGAGNVSVPGRDEVRTADTSVNVNGAVSEAAHQVMEVGMSDQRSTTEMVSQTSLDDSNRRLPSILGQGLVVTEVQQIDEQVTAAARHLDVQMQDGRIDSVIQDAEGGSQESGGRGATVGESLRSLEAEIGSADGRDLDERQVGVERFASVELQQNISIDVVPRVPGSNSRDEAVNDDEEMGGAETSGDHGDHGIVNSSGLASSQDESVEPVQHGLAAGVGSESELIHRNVANAGVNAIDPSFLEALPEDLRAEVLASQQTQSARTASHPHPPAEDIDPEFLAALPPDIQAEVLSQQRAQRVFQGHPAEGQPVDMDSASIIATFPVELREEVLLTTSEAVLAALPPALHAEAQLLRERATNQYQARGLFGGHRFGDRRNTAGAGLGGGTTALYRGVDGGVGLSMGRGPGMPFSSGTQSKDLEGKPLVDLTALKSMLRLLCLAQPLGKGLLQRLLLNLCAHSVTRVTLLQLLLDMLRPEAEFVSSDYSGADGAQSLRLFGCQWNVVYARSQLSDGVPPLVSRRVLEILTYLARNHSSVASLLLYLGPGSSSPLASLDSSAFDDKKAKGKAKVVDVLVKCEEPVIANHAGEVPLILLLKLLSKPPYSRSSAHLEQVMGLLEVGLSSVERNDGSPEAQPLDASVERNDGSSEAQPLDASVERNDGSTEAQPIDASVERNDGSTEAQPLDASVERNDGSTEAQPLDASVDRMKVTETSTSGSEHKMDVDSVLLSLPEPELQNLCKLLARDGLSDIAYSRTAEVVKKLAIAAPSLRRLLLAELADAAKKLSEPGIDELQSIADNPAFSPTAMAGAAILRVLQALSALAFPVSVGNENEDLIEKGQEEGVVIIRDLNFALENMWFGLSTCVGKIEGRLGNFSTVSSVPSSSAPVGTVFGAGAGAGAVPPPLPPGAQKLLPFVEGFSVLCENLRTGPNAAGQSEPFSSTAREIKEAASSSVLELEGGLSLRSPPTLQRKPDEKGVSFVRFADKHRRLLNAFLRQNPGLLEKSLSLMLKTPRVIDFDNKRAYFRSRIRQQHEQQRYAPLRINVRRAYLLEDSYNQLRMRTPDELKGRLTVQFHGEEGVDAGGLTREWYQLLSRVTFDKGALLFTTVGNDSTFQPNPNSVYQTEHLSYFKFVGRVVGKALLDGQLLDVYFTRSFYKHILGVKVTYDDIEAIDPDYHKNLKWMLENDVNDILGLTFSMDADEEKHILYEKTEVTDYELIPNGRNIRVTEENKHEYVDLVAEFRLTTAIRPQITSFLEGFNELVSREVISIFNDKELELLISGFPEIDLEDLKANTEYSGYTMASPVVQWFWEVVRAFNKEDMARLLQFITGTSKVPLEGFRALQGISGRQRFQVHKAYGATDRLPSAHTCFNQLDLPEYTSRDQLQDRLLLAIHEGSEGFGFG